MGWMESEWGNNRWGMDIDHVPVTIGADDGTSYELIFATLADFKSTWGRMDQNYVIHFSDPNDWVSADDPVLAPYNESAVYYTKTTGEAVNNVVIGNLTDYTGDACLKFDGSKVLSVTSSASILDKPIKISFITGEDGSSYLMDQSPFEDGGFYIRVNSGAVKMLVFQANGTGVSCTSSRVLPVGSVCNAVFTANTVTGNIEIDVNGVVDTKPFDGTYKKPITTDIFSIGNVTGGGTLPFKGYVTNISMDSVFSYDIKGSYGNLLLHDTSGSGTDGVLSNIDQWWGLGDNGKPIDQVFATPLLYRNQLPSTPVEVQHVTYTDKTQPYYPTGDAFWGLYTETWLTVASLGGNVYLLRQSGLNYSVSMGL